MLLDVTIFVLFVRIHVKFELDHADFNRGQTCFVKSENMLCIWFMIHQAHVSANGDAEIGAKTVEI